VIQNVLSALKVQMIQNAQGVILGIFLKLQHVVLLALQENGQIQIPQTQGKIHIAKHVQLVAKPVLQILFVTHVKLDMVL
jgi:hypothetical protein